MVLHRGDVVSQQPHPLETLCLVKKYSGAVILIETLDRLFADALPLAAFFVVPALPFEPRLDSTGGSKFNLLDHSWQQRMSAISFGFGPFGLPERRLQA